MISVIVPVYNVEKQLIRCIESLKKIIEPDDVEFILVDDGSTDSCGHIVDTIDDSKFHVFHTENNGLSAARNFGIDHSNGDWLMFVDSDDWVEPEFCNIPYKKAKQVNADLVIFSCRKWKNGKIVRLSLCHMIKKLLQGKNTDKWKTGIITPEIAVEHGGAVAWNKLYKRKLFENIRYPEGRVYEDIATTHKLIYEAERIMIIPNILYNHVYRADSISHHRSEKNIRDRFISAQERYDYLCNMLYPLEKNQTMLWDSAMAFLATTSSNNEMIKKAESILDSIHGLPKCLTLKKRMMLLVWKIDKRLFYLICRTFGLKRA